MNIDLTGRFDPSAELIQKSRTLENVVISVNQRNGRKYLTTIKNIEYHIGELSPIDFLKACRDKFTCGGCIVKDDEGNILVQLQGNHREAVKAFLVEKFDISRSNFTDKGI